MTNIHGAWVTLLTGDDDAYLNGIIVLQYALLKVRSQYPLVVLYTADEDQAVVHRLQQLGCHLRAIDAVDPPGRIEYSQARFRTTWSKLAVWNLVEYDRLVLVDADMLPLGNMDELMAMPLPLHHVAACHACTCNPQKEPNYPADWVPANCEYTHMMCTRTEREEPRRHYFNSGLIVLRPDAARFSRMLQRLYAMDDLNSYVFPDQDFLNEEFEGHWTPLPYTYNALKPMVVSHPALWDMNRIKNVHYILAKPWDVNWAARTERTEYYPLYEKWTTTFAEACRFYNLSIDRCLTTPHS
ncbi:nucleotide-diphospho-sugar transferase [Gongronella butleri]|nr:nucleotide-diphospho-sugar transferase [Gongronella butleri]